MSWRDLDIAPVLDISARDIFAWEGLEILEAPGEGAWFIIPAGCNSIQMTLIPTNGSGKLQTTTDKVNEIKYGNPSAIDWPSGVITDPKQDYCLPVSAIRQINISGTTKFTMRVQ